MHLPILLALTIFAAPLCSAIAAEKAPASVLPQYKAIGGNPGPQYNYVCPNTDGKSGLDCYFDAVQHLYTMCRHVKSIEIIEFGYEKSEEGVNGAKSESCVDKQRVNITRPYQAALREASISRQAVEAVRSLQEFWLDALVKLKWKSGESDAEYKVRVDHVYDDLRDRIDGIRKIVSIVREKETPAPKSARDKKQHRS